MYTTKNLRLENDIVDEHSRPSKAGFRSSTESTHVILRRDCTYSQISVHTVRVRIVRWTFFPKNGFSSIMSILRSEMFRLLFSNERLGYNFFGKDFQIIQIF